MKLSRIQIQNFRNFSALDLRLDGNAVIVGENIFVTEQHLAEWCDAAIAYWMELGKIVDEYRKTLG